MLFVEYRDKGYEPKNRIIILALCAWKSFILTWGINGRTTVPIGRLFTPSPCAFAHKGR